MILTYLLAGRMAVMSAKRERAVVKGAVRNAYAGKKFKKRIGKQFFFSNFEHINKCVRFLFTSIRFFLSNI